MKKRAVFKRGEILPLEMLVKLAGVIQDLSSATLTLGIKKDKSDNEYAVRKMDGDFNKVQAAQGVVSVLVEWNMLPGIYVGELQAEYPDSTRDKSLDIPIEIQPAVNVPDPVLSVVDRATAAEVAQVLI